jgi:WhiB family transcriptional regulator, redox-sensing transcriptional regulator
MSFTELPSSAAPTSSDAPSAEGSPINPGLRPITNASKPPMATAGLLSIVDATWNNLSWRQHRACADLDTNMFFPIGLTTAALEQTTLAKSICQSCPVNNQCLEFALRTLQDYGIWGGRTEDERRVIRRTRRAAARRAAVAAKAAEENSTTSHSESINWLSVVA